MKIFSMRCLIIALCVAGLTACSSKPGSSDIQKELAEAYKCRVLELSEVKKNDGAEVGKNLYDVAFSYTISVKGGKGFATNLLAEWDFLDSQRELAVKKYEQAEREETDRIIQNRSPAASGVISIEEIRKNPKVQQANLMKAEITNRLNTLVPCENYLEVFVLQSMLHEFREAAKSGQEKIPAPFVAKISTVGRMAKSEKGWHFAAMPNLVPPELIKSEPMAYPKFKPLVTEESKSSADAKDITARGKLISGRQDSIIEGENGEGPSFMTQSAVAKEIFAVCSDGDVCEIQGKVDPRDGFLTSVSSVKKIK